MSAAPPQLPAPEFADDDSLPCVRLPSTWRREASVDVATTQTLPVSYAEGGTQTNVKTTSEVGVGCQKRLLGLGALHPWTWECLLGRRAAHPPAPDPPTA